MEARVYTADELRPGIKISYDRDITEEDILAFARLSGDENPLHTDERYAAQTIYKRRIVHGAFQVGLASAFLGMHLPGRDVLLGSVNSRFPAPLYFPTVAKISGEITSWNRQALAGQVRVVIQEALSSQTTAEVSIGFTLREVVSPNTTPRYVQPDVSGRDGDLQKLVVVTGASGGLGPALVAGLAERYRVLALTNRQSLSDNLRQFRNVSEQKMDLTSENLENSFRAMVGERSIYGLVHAAWPGAPRGSLLQADSDTIKSQVDFGTVLTVRLARLLFEHADKEGARFVAIGSTAGSLKPYLPLGVYSLGKACLENTIRLLAPELARKKITINAACPSFVPVGINKEADQRKIMTESAAIPMGRVCTPEDVAGLVRYLLSAEASFVSGQTFALTGAQL